MYNTPSILYFPYLLPFSVIYQKILQDMAPIADFSYFTNSFYTSTPCSALPLL